MGYCRSIPGQSQVCAVPFRLSTSTLTSTSTLSSGRNPNRRVTGTPSLGPAALFLPDVSAGPVDVAQLAADLDLCKSTTELDSPVELGRDDERTGCILVPPLVPELGRGQSTPREPVTNESRKCLSF